LVGWGPATGYDVNGELALTGLALTPEAQGFLIDSLGLLKVGVDALKAAGPDVGSVTLQTRYAFGATVPEPETHALMGLGLLAVAWAVRASRQRKA
jgi:hypothetical protein